MENSQLTASYFNVIYTPNDTTIKFDINAISTLNGYLKARVDVYIYGLNVVTKSLTFCSLNVKTLCPISSGRIDVDSNYKLGSSIYKQIPGAAYTIPDLDAKVRINVYSTDDTSSSNSLACVEAILTNGRTVNTKYASWPIAAVAGSSLIVSGVFSLTGFSNTAVHIASNSLSLFVYFQNIAITSMMGVKSLPPIAAAWCQNFQWSMGIVDVGFLKKFANWYVQSTGGSATSVLENKDVLTIAVQKRSLRALEYLDTMQKIVKRSMALNHLLISKRSSSNDFLQDSTMYTTDESNSTALTSRILVLRGIQRVSYLSNIEITSIFIASISFTLFFTFVVTLLLILFRVLLGLIRRFKGSLSKRLTNFKENFTSILKGVLFRLFLYGLPQIILMCIWELTERDSSACIVIAVILLVVVLGALLFATVKIILFGSESEKQYKNPAYNLFGNEEFLNKYGFLYVQYNAKYYYWIGVSLLYILLRSIFIATLQKHGEVQAILVFVVEFIYFVLLCFFRPYMDKRTNVFNILINLVNLINAVFFMIFSGVFTSRSAVPSISGLVFFILNAVCSLILLIFTIVTCLIAIFYKNPDSRYVPVKDDRVSFLKSRNVKDPKTVSTDELNALGNTALKGHENFDLTDFMDQSKPDMQKVT